MSGGKVLQIDTPKGLYERPNCLEVAGFVGTMNLFPATLRQVANGRAEADGGALGTFSGAPAEGIAPGKPIFAAVRPEKILIAAGQAPVGENAVRGRVSAISYLGDRSHYIVNVPGVEAPVQVYRSNLAPAGGDAGEGAEVTLSWDAANALFLGR